MDDVTAYPLAWPLSVPRTRTRSRAAFRGEGGRRGVTIREALDRLHVEMGRFYDRTNLDRLIVSCNLKPRLDGLPYSGQAEPEDPGVAVYFLLDGERRCIPSDKWDRVADNIAGIAAAIGALRGLERWVNDANVRAAFQGFAALPDPNALDWRAIFGFRLAAVRVADVHNAYRRLALECHPDRGGSHEEMQRINRARDQALNALRESDGGTP